MLCNCEVFILVLEVAKVQFILRNLKQFKGMFDWLRNLNLYFRHELVLLKHHTEYFFIPGTVFVSPVRTNKIYIWLF